MIATYLGQFVLLGQYAVNLSLDQAQDTLHSRLEDGLQIGPSDLDHLLRHLIEVQDAFVEDTVRHANADSPVSLASEVVAHLLPVIGHDGLFLLVCDGLPGLGRDFVELALQQR